MRVVAFVGPSGTGKSYRALTVAHDYGSEAIIDDGLLIKGTKILAGSSAKSEQNKVQAVKRAIFLDKEHQNSVKTALRKSGIKNLLIIGTSDKMADKICERLELPAPSEYVRIQDVASKHEMTRAREMRIKEGKHIVPVPTIELKPHLTGVLIDLPHRLFGRKQKKRAQDEKSIVRPNFSYYGRLTVSDYVVIDIVKIIMQKQPAVDKISDIRVRRPADANKGMTIYLELVLFYGSNIFNVVKVIQNKIKDKVEIMTAMPVREVNVSIRSLSVKMRGEKS
jgi:uncharacterized alkaline shock family protein YloU